MLRNKPCHHIVGYFQPEGRLLCSCWKSSCLYECNVTHFHVSSFPGNEEHLSTSCDLRFGWSKSWWYFPGHFVGMFAYGDLVTVAQAFQNMAEGGLENSQCKRHTQKRSEFCWLLRVNTEKNGTFVAWFFLAKSSIVSIAIKRERVVLPRIWCFKEHTRHCHMAEWLPIAHSCRKKQNNNKPMTNM